MYEKVHINCKNKQPHITRDEEVAEDENEDEEELEAEPAPSEAEAEEDAETEEGKKGGVDVRSPE